MNKKFGVPISQLRKQWMAQGLCRQCGGELTEHHSTCAQCRSRHAARRRRRNDTPKPLLITLPRATYESALADARERGETIEQWIVAEITASVEAGD